MKRVKFKKIIALVIGATLLVPTIGVKAAESAGQARKYVALGDSISYGMSAEQGKGYVDLVYNNLRLTYKDISLKNLSVPGATSSDLLKIIEAKVQDIQGADVVTISIGGNNFLKPTIMAVSSALGVDPTSKNLGNEIRVKIAGDPKGSQNKLTALKDNKTYIEALGQGANQLVKDFPQVIALVKQGAPQSKIYVNNLYNPFPQTNPFYSVYEKICTEINTQLSILSSERAGSLCKVVDAYSLFKGRIDYVNFDFVTGNVDPHPSAIGHAVLSEKLLEVVASDMKNSNVPSKNDNGEAKKTDGQIYKTAYDATMKALESKTQKDINEARKLLVNMPTQLNWAKGEFSTKLDKVQNEIIKDFVLAVREYSTTKSVEDMKKVKELLESLMTVEYNEGVQDWVSALIKQF